MEPSLSTALAAFAVELRPEDLPAEVVEKAKLQLLDTLGCGLAALGLGAGCEARAIVRTTAADDAALLGGGAADIADAAWANGTLCHALDFDDTHAAAICHVSAVLAPTMLAVAGARGASGAEGLAALVAGYEVTTRVGLALGPALLARGLHPTAVCGVFGATAVAARLDGLDRRRTAHAFGIAGSSAAGILECLADGSTTKALHAGAAARAGIVAAQLAARGVTGPARVLEGRFGIARALPGAEPAALAGQLADLGARWETLRIGIKPFPACHAIHGVLAAAQRLGLPPFDPAAIERVVARAPAGALAFIAEPAAAKRAPRTGYEAKFSLPYSVATQLVHGEAGIGRYRDEAVRDPAVLDLARRVACEPLDVAGGGFPGAIEVLAGGRTHAARVDAEPGGPDHPLPQAAIREKFRGNAGLALPAGAVRALEAAILALDGAATVDAALAV